MLDPFELCLFVYLHVFSFNLFSSDIGVGGIKKWLSYVRPSVPKIVSTTSPRRYIRLS